MQVRTIKQIVRTDTYTLVKLHLYIKLTGLGIVNEFSERELAILANLHCFGGVDNKEREEKFFNLCVDKKLTKNNSKRSIENVLSKGRRFGVLKHRKVNNWQLDKDIIPSMASEEVFGIQYLIVNA